MTFLTIRIFGDGQHVGLYFWRWPTLGRGPLDVTIYVCAGSDRAGLNLLEKVAKLRKRDLTDGDDG